MQYIKWNSNLLWQINHGTPTRFLRSLSGEGWPVRENVIEQQGNLYANLFRGVRVRDKVLIADFDISPDPDPLHANLEAEVLQWENWHTSLMAAAVLEIMKDNGTILQLDAVPNTSSWRPNGPNARVVTQSWISPAKWWRGATEQSASGTYNGGTPVTVSCTNAGTLPTWLRFDVTGVVDTPKVATSEGNVVEINVDMTHANDALAIVCTPPATVTYTPNGGSATNYYGYRTSATTFTLMLLPVGTTDLTLTASSGNAGFVAYWYNRFGAM